MEQHSGMDSSSLKPRGDTRITYNIVYTASSGKRTFSTVQEYASKDFLTFIFCGKNHEALCELNSQLGQEGLILELNDTSVCCTVSTPITTNEEAILKLIFNEIQRSVLNMQERLEFEEIRCPIEEPFLRKLMKSSAKRNNLLQMEEFEELDQNNCTKNHYLWLVYPRACKDEITMCKCEAYYTKYSVPMDPNKAQILMSLGLLQAVKEHIKHDLHIEVDSSGIHIFALKHTLNTMIGNFQNFISEFDRNITSTNIGCPVQQHDVLLLPKVAEGLQNAVAFHNVFLQINMPKCELCLFARTEICLTDAVKVVKETLDELTVKITNEISAVLQQDNWKDFMESVEKAEFVIKQTKQSLHIAGLKGAVENVKQFIIDLKEQNSRNSDVEMLDDDRITARRDEGTQEKIPVNTNEGFNYIKKFCECSTKICFESYDTSHSQGFVLTGPKLEVQKGRQKIEAMLSKVTINTYKFEDNGYFSEKVGFDFLEAKVEKYCQVLFDFRPNHRKKSRSGHNESNVFGTKMKSHLDWEVNKELTLFKRKLDQGCQLVLAVTKVDTIGAEVVIETEEKKRGKVQTPQYSWSWNKNEHSVKIQLPLPQYHPSAELDDVNRALKEVFERMVADGLTSVKVSLDSTATWPLTCFVPRLLRVFLGCVRDPANKASVLNLSLLLCCKDGVSIEEAKKICTAVLGEESADLDSGIKGDGHLVSIRIVKGRLNEMKADVLVNTAPPDLNLSNGQVSRSLMEVAGREMQREVYQKYKDSFTSDDIAVTVGYKLKCQYVFHRVLFPYDGEPANAKAFYEESVHIFVTRCLNKAEELDCSSIAFPAIGTGRLQYSPESVASSMFLAVTEYNNKHPDTGLEEVMFVVYPADTEALQAFELQEEDIIAQKLEQNNQSSTITIQLVGPEENINKAKQVIEDRLEWLKDKDAEKASPTTVKIHGVSDASYKLLDFFHPEVIAKYEEKGCQFNCEDEVLTIQADSKDIKTVETEINHCLVVNKQLSVEELTAEGIDLDAVEDILNGRNKDEVCYIMDREKHKVLLFGTFIDTVQRQKAQLNALFTMALKKVSSQKGMSKTMKDTGVCKNAGMSKADDEKVLESTRGSKIDGESKVKDTLRSKTAVDKVKIDNVPFEYYMVMKKMNDTFFQKCTVSYDSDHKQVCLDMRNKKEFDKLLSEVQKLQTQDIVVHKTQKDCESFNDSDYDSDNVVCIYNTDTSTISVYGHEMKLVQAKVHQIRVDLGLVGKNERGTRQLTESFQMSDSPDSDDEKSQGTDYHSKGARPKDRTGQAPILTHELTDCETFYTNEGISVRVYTRNILHLHVDCIVNAANDTLKHGGGIAEVISKAAGYYLDKDCSDFIKTNGKLQAGEVYVSEPGKLNYRCVVHAVGPRWSDYKPHAPDDITRCKRDLFMAVLHSFLKAEERRMKTIAVPAISSAVFKVPKEICTEMYAAAVLVYSKQASSANRLREIHFIDNKPDIIRLIQGTFRKTIPNGPIPEFLQKKRSGTSKQVSAPTPATVTSKADRQRTKQPSSKSAMDYPFPYVEEIASEGGFKHQLHCHFSKTLELIIDAGSVFDKAKLVDGIVCSDNKAGESKGYIAKALLDKGGNKYKTVKEKAFKWVKFGDVVVLKGDGTGFGKVFLAIMWNKDPGDSDFQRQEKFKKMFKSVFKKVSAEKCNSVVMPLLFTGQGKVNPDFCTDRFLESCMEFSKEETKSMLTIYLINNEKWKTETIERITKEFVNVQTALTLSTRTAATKSKPARPLPPRPANPEPGKQTSNPTNRTRREQEKHTYKNPKHNSSRPHANQKQHRSSADVGRLSSSLMNVVVGSSNSKSKFYDDDDDVGTAQTYSQHTPVKSTEINVEEEDDDSDNGQGSQDETCVICMDTVTNPKELKCGHVFCTDCIDNYFSNYKKVCPTCGAVCGVVKGDQPYGTIDVKFDKKFHCAGYEKAGSIIITYSFDSGTQGPDHPNPGKWFKGITRVGYLPDTKEGKEVLKMLEVAFKRKLVFTIGGSRTTGQEGVITWNDIHHKTNPNPNTPFGYPDPSYLNRVKDELAAKGVTPDDIPASYRCN